MITQEDILKRMLLHHAEKRPFVIYCKPGSGILVGVFQYENRTEEFSFGRKGFIFHSFHGNRAVFLDSNHCDIVQSTADSRDHQSKSIATDTSQKEDFEHLVAKAVSEIQNGAFQKVVLARRETLSIKIDIVKTFENLLTTYPAAFRYCFYHPDTGLWMGATPEKLISVSGKHFSTMSLAGTQNHHDGNVVWGDKEIAEQQYVTDFITSELSSVASEIQISERKTHRAGNIMHLKTDITGTIGEGTIGEVVRKLHPTPAVCGLPKSDALKFILQNEKFDREFYSGFLGELNVDFASGSATTDLYVNLRCMKIESNEVHIYVGCGITADSDPEKEFRETVNKSMTMKKILS